MRRFGLTALALTLCSYLLAQKSTIVYSSEKSGRSGYDLVAYDVSDGSESILTHFKNQGHYPHAINAKISPDGTTLLAQVDLEGHDRYSLYTMQMDGSGLEKLPVAEALYPSWATDGKKVVYTGRRQGFWEILSFDLTTGQETNLSRNRANQKRPGWGAQACFSPDGKLIVYTYVREKRLTIMDTEGRELFKTNDGKSYTNPRWSNNGKHIAAFVKSSDSYDLMLLDHEGRVLDTIDKDVISYSTLAWSPDDSRIAYCKMVNEQQEIFIIDRATGKTQNISRHRGFDAHPTWAMAK